MFQDCPRDRNYVECSTCILGGSIFIIAVVVVIIIVVVVIVIVVVLVVVLLRRRRRRRPSDRSYTLHRFICEFYFCCQ